MDTFGEYVYRVRSYECGVDGRVSVANVCNYLQDAATMNAAALGFARDDFLRQGEDISWVLTRLRVQMTRYPVWGETVKVLTYPCGGRRITALRDFVLTTAAGDSLGIATSEWVIINLQTRRMVTIPESVYALSNTVRPPVMGESPFVHRLRLPPPMADMPVVQPLRCPVQFAHIDLNGHVNNVCYIEWLQEVLPATPADFEIVFRSETRQGEEVLIESRPESPDGECFARVCSPDGADHVVARSRGVITIPSTQGVQHATTRQS